MYYCDNCNESFAVDSYNRTKPNGENILTTVSIVISAVGQETSSYSDKTKAEKHICRACLEKIGLVFDLSRQHKDDTPTHVSLQDKLMEVLSELGVKFEE